jgi:beta-glucuronidase
MERRDEMIRLFNNHKIRNQIELEGLWDFATIADNQEWSLPIEFKYRLPVPGCWESHPELSRYRGRGLYRRKIHIKEESSLRLTFKGVSHSADVYFDGNKVVSHYNAYTSFSAIVPKVKPGEHELLICVDNSFGEHSSLHLPNDYYTYGGIIRPVVLEYIPDLFIERMEFKPLEEDGWKAEVTAIVRNIADQAVDVSLTAHLEKQLFQFDSVTVPAGETIALSSRFAFIDVQVWSSENPLLYLLELQLYENGGKLPTDDLIERIGFRTVKVDGDQLIVNGEAVKLKGFNRHEDYAIVGAAIPLQLMVKDMDLLQDMGANCVRTSHYPNDERFLDLCDERGIFVWEESHARSLLLEQMQHPLFAIQSEDCLREMVEQHVNHPSIVIWGVLNECASNTAEGREYFKAQLEQIRRMDRSRPLTFASCHVFNDLCLDLADIVSFNLYPGWYNKESVEEFYTLFKDWVDNNGGAGKPIIVSEFGAEAIYGYRDPARAKWSEEFQSDLIGQSLAFYGLQSEICGSIIWQFSDCRVTEEGDWFISRPRLRNNKGILDEFRRPKLAYEAVKHHFSS